MKRDDIPDLVYDAERITPKPDQFNGSTPVLELFAYVLNEIENIQIGESFLIRDLFKGYIWNRLFQNQKTELGRWVSDYLDLMSNDFEGGRYLSYEGKTKQKQMIMRIVDDYEERKKLSINQNDDEYKKKLNNSTIKVISRMKRGIFNNEYIKSFFK